MVHPCVLQDIGPLGPLPKKYLKCAFSHFPTQSLQTNRQTDQWMDGPTDRGMNNPSYRVACLQLKIVLDPCHILGLDHAWMIVNVSESMQGSSPQVIEVLLTQGRVLIEHVQPNADD